MLVWRLGNALLYRRVCLYVSNAHHITGIQTPFTEKLFHSIEVFVYLHVWNYSVPWWNDSAVVLRMYNLKFAKLQSINQSIHQSSNQSSNQSINQSIKQSIKQSINQSINHHSINQSINHHSINQLINQSCHLQSSQLWDGNMYNSSSFKTSS